MAAVQENIPVFISVGSLCLQEGYQVSKCKIFLYLKVTLHLEFLMSSFIWFSPSSLSIGSTRQFLVSHSFCPLCPYDVFPCCYSIVWQKYRTSLLRHGMPIIYNTSAMFKWLGSWFFYAFQKQLWQGCCLFFLIIWSGPLMKQKKTLPLYLECIFCEHVRDYIIKGMCKSLLFKHKRQRGFVVLACSWFTATEHMCFI